MEKEFEDYLHKVRNSFVDEVNKTPIPKELGIKIHEFLVAFDQLKWKLRESQNASTSDEALHIGSVVESLPDETCSASNCNGFIVDGKCDRCG